MRRAVHVFLTQIIISAHCVEKKDQKCANPECQTSSDSSQNPAQACLFPFIVEGIKYNHCADVQKDGVTLINICATKRDGLEMLEYGQCGQDCHYGEC